MHGSRGGGGSGSRSGGSHAPAAATRAAPRLGGAPYPHRHAVGTHQACDAYPHTYPVLSPDEWRFRVEHLRRRGGIDVSCDRVAGGVGVGGGGLREALAAGELEAMLVASAVACEPSVPPHPHGQGHGQGQGGASRHHAPTPTPMRAAAQAALACLVEEVARKSCA